MMPDSSVKLIGVYSVDENPDVTLLELIINKNANEIDIAEFTQEIINEPRDNWQVPFGEKYLDIDGNTIIGDDLDLPEVMTETTRLTFFFYFLDTTKPLMTPFGKVELMPKTLQPKRVKDLIEFEDPE